MTSNHQAYTNVARAGAQVTNLYLGYKSLSYIAWHKNNCFSSDSSAYLLLEDPIADKESFAADPTPYSFLVEQIG